MNKIRNRMKKLSKEERKYIMMFYFALKFLPLKLFTTCYFILMPQLEAEIASLLYNTKRPSLSPGAALACEPPKKEKLKQTIIDIYGKKKGSKRYTVLQNQPLITAESLSGEMCGLSKESSSELAAVSSDSSSVMQGITRTLPTKMNGAASIVRHSGNGRVYVSTNGSYLVELSASNLSILRSKYLNMGRAHQLTSNGQFLYVHVSGDNHKVLKIRTSDLAVIDSTPSLNGKGSPEGFIFLNGSLFLAIGGPPGKIVKVNPKNMSVLATWNLPGGIENHGLTTDGLNLFVLGVPQRNVKANKYFKLSPSLSLLDTITFPWIGTLGGNLYHSSTGLIYTSGGRLSSLSPKTMAVVKSATPTDHWLANDASWLYRLSYEDGFIQVVNPSTLKVVFTKATGATHLHFGIVQNGYLWVAHEVNYKYGVVGRYKLY